VLRALRERFLRPGEPPGGLIPPFPGLGAAAPAADEAAELKELDISGARITSPDISN
jgi:hypothetical protein